MSPRCNSADARDEEVFPSATCHKEILRGRRSSNTSAWHLFRKPKYLVYFASRVLKLQCNRTVVCDGSRALNDRFLWIRTFNLGRERGEVTDEHWNPLQNPWFGTSSRHHWWELRRSRVPQTELVLFPGRWIALRRWWSLALRSPLVE